jgi:hypothetical protein
MLVAIFKACVHRSHEHPVFQSGEAKIKRREQIWIVAMTQWRSLVRGCGEDNKEFLTACGNELHRATDKASQAMPRSPILSVYCALSGGAQLP